MELFEIRDAVVRQIHDTRRTKNFQITADFLEGVRILIRGRSGDNPIHDVTHYSPALQ